MKIQTAYSPLPEAAEAAAAIGREISNSPRLVVFFASSRHEPAAIARAMQAAFPDATVVGCTTAGEIAAGRMLKGSVVAMGFSAEAIAGVQVQLVRHPATPGQVDAALARFEDQLGVRMNDLDHTRYVGLVLIDGLSRSEERVMDRLGDLTNVAFIGGSAGDDLKFERTHVFSGGEAHTDAALLVLLEPAAPFEILKTQSFEALGATLQVSEADAEQREVVSFNGKPACQAYAEAVGVAPEAASEAFMRNPVGLMVGGEPFVRSPQQVKGDRMAFYCNVLEGMELQVLRSGPIVADTRAALAGKVAEMGGVAGVLNFNCILRTLDLEAKGEADAYGALFADVPTVGFSTYGEAYLGHINQTATMLLFR